MPILLGCIADDSTGATDLAGMLVKAGMRTVQLIGVPAGPVPEEADAIVVALKSRTAPASEAVAESLAALAWLRSAGARQCFFKYCSTFDSTPRGNIGPVAEALLEALGGDFTVFCPAFPANGRTLHKGYLFVGPELLSESGMRNHPLNPMTDSNLVRWLGLQARTRVGLVDFEAVRRGPGAIRARFDQLRREGVRLAVVDAASDPDLLAIGAACEGLALVTGGSGVAMGLPENFRQLGLLGRSVVADRLPATGGHRAVLAGSCSQATQRQVAVMRERGLPAFQVDPLRLAEGADLAGEALAWAGPRLAAGPVLVYATAPADTLRQVQARLGAERAGLLVETALATVARGLVAQGVGQLIVAGGETSGRVVQALGVTGLRIGPEIDPGVPWTVALQGPSDRPPLALALKSGNFGSEDFFLKAWSHLA
jgi:uncharacterized protein YgbK (DUF1537 family)